MPFARNFAKGIGEKKGDVMEKKSETK